MYAVRRWDNNVMSPFLLEYCSLDVCIDVMLIFGNNDGLL
jgi:hypothetical protein